MENIEDEQNQRTRTSLVDKGANGGNKRTSSSSSSSLWRLFCCCCCCCYRRGKSRLYRFNYTALFFGQFLSFLVAAAGAAQATLELDCHLSAPALSVTPFYFCLALGLIPLYCLQSKRNGRGKLPCHPKKTDRPKQLVSSASMELVPEVNLSPFKEEDSAAFLVEQDEKKKSANRLSLGGNKNKNKGNQTVSSKNTEGVFRSYQSTQPTPSEHGPYSFLRLIPLSNPLYLYALVALADFYANYLTVWAFHYTTITSVAITDALAIPSAMVLSRFWLKREYACLHFVGVLVCMMGIGLNMFSDYEKDSEAAAQIRANGATTPDKEAEEYPHKALGDFLGIMGGCLFGISNTMAEKLVRNSSHSSAMRGNLEYLSMLGFFASMISGIQVAVFEADRLDNFLDYMKSHEAADTCSRGKAVRLWMAFSVCCFMVYVGTARFLQVSEAVFYNLSLLTGDFWSVLFSVFEEHIPPLPLFYPSLVLIIGGTVLYEMTPTPVLSDQLQQQQELELYADVAASGSEEATTDFQQDIEMKAQQPQDASSVISRASQLSTTSASTKATNAWV